MCNPNARQFVRPSAQNLIHVGSRPAIGFVAASANWRRQENLIAVAKTVGPQTAGHQAVAPVNFWHVCSQFRRLCCCCGWRNYMGLELYKK